MNLMHLIYLHLHIYLYVCDTMSGVCCVLALDSFATSPIARLILSMSSKKDFELVSGLAGF